METKTFSISGPLLITPEVFHDERGKFFEAYEQERYRGLGLQDFVQDNISCSKKGVIRGLHYQISPHAQGKLVQVLRGRVLDVAVDIRFGSPTYGQFVMIELSAEHPQQFWIPCGFAHGFEVLENETIFSYKCTAVYSKIHERGIRFDDPTLQIDWKGEESIVSSKDLAFPFLADMGHDFVFQETV